MTRTGSAIIALVREAKDLRYTPILRTIVHKLVYLLDLYTAERSGGKTFTGEVWTFHHFGPYSQAVANTMDNLAVSRLLYAETGESSDGDKEYTLYSPWGSAGPALRELELPRGVSITIDSDLKRFARDLPALLDYVYFRTRPMADAAPGDRLVFTDCEKTNAADFKPIVMKPMTASQLKKAREKVYAAYERRVSGSRKQPVIGRLDEAYIRAMRELDGEPLSVGLEGIAKISKD